MSKYLYWLDQNIIAVLAGFLLVFIPLYPKWPLFDILYGYSVRVRMEDFAVLFTGIIFCLWILRRKIRWVWGPTQFGLFVYLAVGMLSMLTAFFIIQTVPLEYLYVAKTSLHWLRRIEYFSLFFIFFAAIRSIKVTKAMVVLIFVTLGAVILYGYGQKYLYFPAFSTMNREFAKGIWLRLTAHSRVLSTFGGHYDLAAYLVMTLSLAWSFYFGSARKLVKFILALLIVGGFWLLILTASRSSFMAYILATSVVIFLWTFKKGFNWGISRWAVVMVFSFFVLLTFGDLSDRFLHLLKLDERVTNIRAVLLNPAVSAPTGNSVFLENTIAAVTSPSDQPPTPVDINVNQPELLMASISATGQRILVQKQRTYSQNALVYDLSTAIRLDSTWPKAISSFKADPLFGTGYATLSQSNKFDFTVAESTDNDFLRALGETGALGFLALFGTIFFMAIFAFRALGGISDGFLYSLVAGFVALVLGLLVNAVLVDIFEASKVAYVFWGVSGITMATLYRNREQIAHNRQPMRIIIPWADYRRRIKSFFRGDVFWVGLIAILVVGLRLYKFDGPVADWHSWRQADTSAVTRNFLASHSINWLYPTYDDISSLQTGKPNPLGLRYVEFPVYNAASVFASGLMPEFTVEEAGRAVTILSAVLGMVFVFLLTRKTVSRRAAYLAAIVYAVVPYNIYYGRTILPDPLMTTLSLGAVWFASEFLDRNKKRYLLLTIFLAAAALLVKPFAVFLLLPIGYFGLVNWSKRDRVVTLFVGLLVSVLPFLLWRWWIGHYPEGIPASDWLLNGDGIRFKGAFWYWLFADRMGRLILGYWGLVLLAFGLVQKTVGKYRFFPIILFLSSLLFLFVFATGNVRHDYYQILLIPSLAIMVGIGLDALIFSRNFILGVVGLLFMAGFGWYFVRDYYNINHPEIVEAGRKVESLSDWRALVVAPYDGDTAFLYQSHRKGWPIVEKSIDYLISQGADYYVSVRFDDLTKDLMAEAWPVWVVKPETNKKIYKYKMLAYTDKYVVIQLK